MDKALLERLKPYVGKRFVVSARCSTDLQTETSIPSQLSDIHFTCQAAGMIHAGGDVILDGKSGSKPGNRHDIPLLLARKKEKNDYEILIDLVEDRFTRAGPEHGLWAEFEFLRHGVTVLHLRSDVPEGPFASVIKTLKYESAKQQAKSTSLRSTQVVQDAIEAGYVLASSHTNYGCYRLYLSSDGKPLHIIRDMRDGTQHRLDPVTREYRETLGTLGGKTGRYRKQKRERPMLVPGDEREISAVRLIMKRRWSDGRGGNRVKKELNALGIPAPCGGKWTQRQVDVIAENPVYCGWNISGGSTAALYNKRHRDGPQPVHVDPVLWATRENLPVQLRPPEDWTIQEQPYMRDYLPEALRDVASARIKACRERRARREVAPRQRNTHLDSLYLLTGLLVAKQDEHKRPLKGQNCGPRDYKTRYYAHPIARKDSETAGFPNTTFRAEVLEKAILSTLSETLLAMPELRDELRLAVEAAVNARKPASPMALADLQRKLDGVRAQIKITLDILTPETQEEGRAKVAELSQKRRELEALIRQTKESEQAPALDVEATVESLVQRMADLGKELESLPVYPLRQVLVAMTDSMTADMETREVVMTLRVPPMAISDAKTPIADLCLQHSSGSSTGWQAQNPAPAIATIHCEHHREAQKQCFTCRRVKRAA